MQVEYRFISIRLVRIELCLELKKLVAAQCVLPLNRFQLLLGRGDLDQDIGIFLLQPLGKSIGEPVEDGDCVVGTLDDQATGLDQDGVSEVGRILLGQEYNSFRPFKPQQLATLKQGQALITHN